MNAQDVPTGKIKSFGYFGPKYLVGLPLRRLKNGQWMIEIILVDSGEKTEYSLAHINEDPFAL